MTCGPCTSTLPLRPGGRGLPVLSDDPHLRGGERPAHGAQHGGLLRAHAHDGGGLGEAVALQDVHADGGEEAVQVGGQRTAAADDGLELPPKKPRTRRRRRKLRGELHGGQEEERRDGGEDLQEPLLPAEAGVAAHDEAREDLVELLEPDEEVLHEVRSCFPMLFSRASSSAGTITR